MACRIVEFLYRTGDVLGSSTAATPGQYNVTLYSQVREKPQKLMEPGSENDVWGRVRQCGR